MSEPATQDVLALTAQRFAAAPSFRQAVQQFSDGYLEFRQGPKLLSKLLSHDASWRVIGYLLYLYADREQFGSDGATYGRLLELCTRRNEISRRTLKTMLALLRLAGFVQAHASAADRRVKIYQPTERMMGFVRRWLSYPVATLDILRAAIGAHAIVARRSFFHRALSGVGRTSLHHSHAAHRTCARAQLLLGRAGGRFPGSGARAPR